MDTDNHYNVCSPSSPNSNPAHLTRLWQKYLWGRWRRLARSPLAWTVLTALIALLSTTPGDIGFHLPEWQLVWVVPATAVLVMGCVVPVGYLRAKSWNEPIAAPPPAPPSSRTYLSLISRTVHSPQGTRIAAWYIWASGVVTAAFIHLWRWRHEAHEGLTLDLAIFKPTAPAGEKCVVGTDNLQSTLASHNRHPYHLNERILYLYLGNALFALFLSQKDIFDGSWAKPHWPADNVGNLAPSPSPLRNFSLTLQLHIQATLGQRLAARIKRSVFLQFPLYVSIHGALYTLGFWLLRKRMAALLVRHTFGLFRPFIAQMARNASLVDWRLPFRLLALHYATAVLLRLPAIVFDISATQPFNGQRLDFSPLAAGRKADSYIIDALASSDDYYLTFTALELADRSHQAANRKRVFEDLSTKPTAWTRLFQGCITQLSKSYRILYTRGGRLGAPASGANEAARVKVPLTNIPSAQVKQVQSVFYVPPTATKPAALVEQVKQTDAKLVDMATAGLTYLRQRVPTKDTVEHAGEKALSWISPLEEHLPERVVKPVVDSLKESASTAKHAVENLQHQVQATSSAVSTRASAVVEQVSKPIDTEWRHKGLYPVVRSWVDRVAPGDSIQRRAGERFIYRVETAFARRWARDELDFVLPRRKIDADLIKALAAYVAASLQEDTYGQVQNCVPEIMEMFLKYYSELAAYKREFFDKAEGRGKEAWLVEAQRTWTEEAEVLSKGKLALLPFIQRQALNPARVSLSCHSNRAIRA
ncbi:hypothetical protein QFC19_008288 [Naganishia cerealis]|uniref:Uncharacterized protein n=1 Tax=Naganishia cerealis TaxID=610337 RepID=A0ACC2V3G5_9TREE|nr:hypothetical protein QFC19_008288 [Naganishia cerealis]